MIMFIYVWCVCLYIADVIKKYSNFVGVPIFLNGTRVNVIQVGLIL